MSEIVEMESVKCELVDEPISKNPKKCLKCTLLISLCIATIMTTTTTVLIYLTLTRESLATFQAINGGVCTSASCVKAAGSILSSMDNEVDPCDDFYEYACGGLIKSYTNRDDFYEEMNMVRKIQKILMKVFKHKPKSENSTTETNLRNYYKSCMNETMINLSWKTQVLKIIDEVGGWPILNNTDDSKYVKDVCTIPNLLFEISIIDLKNGSFIKV